MERGNSKHGPKLDEEMQQETEGLIRSGQPNRAEPHRETEPVQPEPGEVSDRPGHTRSDAETSRRRG